MKSRKHPNPVVQTLSKKSLATLRKWQTLVDQQLTFAFHASNEKATHKLQARQRDLQAAVMWKEFKEVI